MSNLHKERIVYLLLLVTASPFLRVTIRFAPLTNCAFAPYSKFSILGAIINALLINIR